MNYKEFLLNDLNAQKDNLIQTIRNTQMSDEERKVVNAKIDSIDARIEECKKLDDQNNSKLDETVKTLNSKMQAITEKLSAKGISMPEVDGDEYLKSKNAMHDFAEAMRNAHTNSSTFSDEWGKMLSKNGITPVGGASGDWSQFMPAPVKGMIQDAWNEYGDVLREFNFTGAKSYMVRANLIDQDGEGYAGGVDDIWALGWDSKYNATHPTEKKSKKEQTLTLSSFVINSEYVYKMIPVSNKSIWDDDTNLIQYVLNELLKQWNYTVLRCILIGDGRTGDTHIGSIAAITSGSAPYVGAAPAQGSEGDMEYFVEKLIEPIHNGDDDILLFVSKEDFTALRKYVPAAGATPTYMSAEDVARMMGVRRIVTVPYLHRTPTSGQTRAIAIHANKYLITGSLTPEFTSWEDYKTNERYYRVEIPVGGAVGGIEAAMHYTEA